MQTLPDLEEIDSLEKIRRDCRLNSQQLKYIENFVMNGGNRQKAFHEAGYSAKTKNTMYVMLSEMHKKPHVKEAIDRFKMLYLKDRRKLIEQDVYRIAHLRATFDVRDFADLLIAGSPHEVAKKIKMLPENVAVSLDGFEINMHPKDPDAISVKLKFASRDTAIKTLISLTGIDAPKKQEVDMKNSGMPMINITVGGGASVSAEPKKVN